MIHWITPFLILFHFASFAQNATVKTPIEMQRAAKKEASEQIKLLSNSVILFRLDSKSEQIAYYEKYNNIHAAEKLKAQTRTFNLKVIQCFRKSFSFCPVYFFEDIHSNALVAGEIDKVVFYNDSLIPDASLKIPPGTTYFIAEHSVTRDEDGDQFRSDSYITSDTSGTVKKTRYYDDGNLGVQALVLMDSKFNQLQRPFPYYHKLATMNISSSRLNVKIKAWDLKFTNFLKENSSSATPPFTETGDTPKSE